MILSLQSSVFNKLVATRLIIFNILSSLSTDISSSQAATHNILALKQYSHINLRCSTQSRAVTIAGSHDSSHSTKKVDGGHAKAEVSSLQRSISQRNGLHAAFSLQVANINTYITPYQRIYQIFIR